MAKIENVTCQLDFWARNLTKHTKYFFRRHNWGGHPQAYQLPAASGVSPWYVKQNKRDWDFCGAYHRSGHREHRHRSEMQHQQEEAILLGLKANRRQGYVWRQNESCAIRAQCDYKAYREKLWKIIIHILSCGTRGRVPNVPGLSVVSLVVKITIRVVMRE